MIVVKQENELPSIHIDEAVVELRFDAAESRVARDPVRLLIDDALRFCDQLQEQCRSLRQSRRGAFERDTM